ncbi:MAG: hypothetical protein KAI35_07865, partial [Desulfobulbaceae bacterium]|nr:hypothetical protein [Desulfobulbaceae bacterium]
QGDKQGDKEKDSEGEQEKGDKDQKEGEQGEEDEPHPELEVPPPDQTARDLLNEEKENRRLRQMQSTHGPHPVEKDW